MDYSKKSNIFETAEVKCAKTNENVFLVFLALLCCILFSFSFLLTPKLVEGNSMYPTLNVIQNTSDVVYIMHQNVYRRGDIVVLHKNNIQSSKDAIKRIIAVGGETVAIKQDHDGFYRVFINNEALDESYISSLNDMKKCYEHFQTYLKNHNIISDYITLEENEIFVLGDNRASSYDSSSYGARTINEIEGKVVVVAPHFYNFLKSLFA